jgi:hypothetical protein
MSSTVVVNWLLVKKLVQRFQNVELVSYNKGHRYKIGLRVSPECVEKMCICTKISKR